MCSSSAPDITRVPRTPGLRSRCRRVAIERGEIARRGGLGKCLGLQLLRDLEKRWGDRFFSILIHERAVGSSRLRPSWATPVIDGRLVVWSAGPRTEPWDVYVHDIDTGQTKILPIKGHSPDVWWDKVAFAGDAGIYLYDGVSDQHG